jgi:hypothetical protein
MLDKVATPNLMAGAPNPFSGWHEGIDGDYQTMFIELWAYLADILTIYQERIANEAFITTATQLDSIVRLVSLINYRPRPGSGASGLVAFTVAKDTSLSIPARFRVGSRAQPSKPSAVFETSSSIAASDDSNAIPLSLVSPTVDFPKNTIVLQGVSNRVAVGDYLLAVENEETANEVANLRQVTAVIPDKTSGTTTVSWQDLTGVDSFASKTVSVYAFRVSAGPFGNNAPPWNSLSPTLTTGETFSPPVTINVGGKPFQPPYPINWDDPGTSDSPNLLYYIPFPSDPPNFIFLDGLYPAVKQSPQNPYWAVLIADGDIHPQILHVTDGGQTSKVAYAISAKVTRLTFAEPVNLTSFPLRKTLILTASERLTLHDALALAPTVSGNTLILTGIHPKLKDGQTVVLQGNQVNASGNPPTAALVAESGFLSGAPVIDLAHKLTTVSLRDPLARVYLRAGCSLLGNIAEVTQGETVKDEVLGSSDGTAFQSYPLKKSPLTYQPSTDPESVAAVESTLSVTVNGVRWTEQSTLVKSLPHDQVFITTVDEAAQTTVIFGDGFNGARPPSGINNVRARYRKGLGSSGNLQPAAIQQLLDSAPGLQKVTNPIPSSGGGDADNIVQIRRNAPASVRTFGRAVSVPDYAALALSYPGIAKAGAAWVVRNPLTMQPVPHPYVQLTLATVDSAPIQGTVFAAKLRRFLNDHRDPNVPLRIQDYSPVYVNIAVTVDIDSRSAHQATLDRAQAALNPGPNPDGSLGYFAFDRLDFGQSIYLSAIYSVVQAVPGVTDVAVTTLRRAGPPPADPVSTSPHDIIVGPTEIAIIDPSDPTKGSLSVSGKGGFSDT